MLIQHALFTTALNSWNCKRLEPILCEGDRIFGEARDEMILAVNSLPEKGRKVHQRVVVAKLQKSSQAGCL